MAGGPVLALIDRAGDDADVIGEAVWLARAARTQVLLVHVAPCRAAARTEFEVGVMGELSAWAEHVRAAGVEAQVEDVYVGEAAAEVAYASNRRCAVAVVAARRPCLPFLARLLGGQTRGVRLARLLRVPLVLIQTRPAAAVTGERGAAGRTRL